MKEANTMDKTKIEWADATWNPVTGCFHSCEYCYARRIAERFAPPSAPRLGDPGMEGGRAINAGDTCFIVSAQM